MVEGNGFPQSSSLMLDGATGILLLNGLVLVLWHQTVVDRNQKTGDLRRVVHGVVVA